MKATVFCLLIVLVVSAGCVTEDTDSNNDNAYSFHNIITVTVFWIGEEGNEDNGFIPNIQSAWDDNWLQHYGGVDDPNNRNGYVPTNFTPSENPFYCALPYNDFSEDGERKSNAYDVVYWSTEHTWDDSESMCKNRWIKITKNDKTAYAQWEDVGPFGEDDTVYVFNDALPSNDRNNKAGLDVSPAVRDYLKLNDIDTVNWHFVDFSEVPDGPWKNIITISQITWNE